MFEYDASAPLACEEVAVERQRGVDVYDLSYSSPMGGRVTAYLVMPPGSGPFAGVLWLHGGKGSRKTFLLSALDLASMGAVSLLIDAPFARPRPWKKRLDLTPDTARDVRVQTILDLRRGIDLLASRPEVDATRLGYVGHSYGASMGGVLVGVEKRLKTAILLAAGPGWSAFVQSSEHPMAAQVRAELGERLERYLELLAPLDVSRFIGQAAPASLLFQAGRGDPIVPPEQAQRCYELASEPKELRWYNGGHSLNAVARYDRLDWMEVQLGLRQR